MHDTGFCTGDIVQRPKQAVEIAHVFKHETCDEAVLASDHDALHDFRQLLEDLLDARSFPGSGSTAKTASSENPRARAFKRTLKASMIPRSSSLRMRSRTAGAESPTSAAMVRRLLRQSSIKRSMI